MLHQEGQPGYDHSQYIAILKLSDEIKKGCSHERRYELVEQIIESRDVRVAYYVLTSTFEYQMYSTHSPDGRTSWMRTIYVQQYALDHGQRHRLYDLIAESRCPGYAQGLCRYTYGKDLPEKQFVRFVDIALDANDPETTRIFVRGEWYPYLNADQKSKLEKSVADLPAWERRLLAQEFVKRGSECAIPGLATE